MWGYIGRLPMTLIKPLFCLYIVIQILLLLTSRVQYFDCQIISICVVFCGLIQQFSSLQ